MWDIWYMSHISSNIATGGFFFLEKVFFWKSKVIYIVWFKQFESSLADELLIWYQFERLVV